MSKQKKFTASIEKIEALKDFLEKFKKINQSLLLEFLDDSVIAKTHTPDRGFIKRSRLDFDGFCEFETDRNEKVIKVPFFNIQRVMKNIDLLPSGPVTLEFLCDETSNYLICREAKFITKSLTISNKCTEMDYIVTLSDEVYDRVIKSATDGAKMLISKQAFSKIYSLSESDNEETISVRIDEDEKGVHFFGPMYDYLIETKISGSISGSIRFKKSFLQYMTETTDIKMSVHDEKVIISSVQDGTETTSIIGTTENE